MSPPNDFELWLSEDISIVKICSKLYSNHLLLTNWKIKNYTNYTSIQFGDWLIFTDQISDGIHAFRCIMLSVVTVTMLFGNELN